jgi:uncharacterized membrane protein YagU involved in acid resistance
LGVDAKRAVLAGLAGTAAMTALWWIEPRIGLAQLAFGDILSSLLAVATAYLSPGPALGWAFHVLVGITFALLYAAAFAQRLSGSPLLRGLLFGLGIFILAQLVFMPLVGAGLFSRGDLPMLLGSLLGHLAYGGVLGLTYGRQAPPASPA